MISVCSIMLLVLFINELLFSVIIEHSHTKFELVKSVF